VAIVHVERITCDNAECVAYVDELIRERPGQYELHEYVRAQASLEGWSFCEGADYCPSHAI
jgi:hypothetical protein